MKLKGLRGLYRNWWIVVLTGVSALIAALAASNEMYSAGIALAAGLALGMVLALLRERIPRLIATLRGRKSGLLSRQALQHQLEEHLTQQSGGSTALGLIELDALIGYIETLPASTVDELTQKVTRVLRHELRGSDIVGRWDDGVFAVILPNTPPTAAVRTLERIRQVLSDPIRLSSGESVSLYPSVGVAASQSGESAGEIITRAEISLDYAPLNTNRAAHSPDYSPPSHETRRPAVERAPSRQAQGPAPPPTKPVTPKEYPDTRPRYPLRGSPQRKETSETPEQEAPRREEHRAKRAPALWDALIGDDLAHRPARQPALAAQSRESAGDHNATAPVNIEEILSREQQREHPTFLWVLPHGPNIQLPDSKHIVLGRTGSRDVRQGSFVNLEAVGAAEAGISRRHAHLFEKGGQMMIEDLKSTNGTFVNEHRLAPYEPTPISESDTIRLAGIEAKIMRA